MKCALGAFGLDRLAKSRARKPISLSYASKSPSVGSNERTANEDERRAKCG